MFGEGRGGVKKEKNEARDKFVTRAGPDRDFEDARYRLQILEKILLLLFLFFFFLFLLCDRRPWVVGSCRIPVLGVVCFTGLLLFFFFFLEIEKLAVASKTVRKMALRSFKVVPINIGG